MIDCHILTLPGDNPLWTADLRRDLDAEPVIQHWLPGIQGQFGRARATGYAQGDAPFVSFADPDDRIMTGTYDLLMEALAKSPKAPYAWAGEQKVDDGLAPIGQPTVHPGGYDARRHRNQLASYVHGVVLIRRERLTHQALSLLYQAGSEADGVLMAYLAGLHSGAQEPSPPVHVPVVGRFWRQHESNAHKMHKSDNTSNAYRLLGIGPQYLHGSPRPSAAPRASQPCVSCGPPRR